MAIRFVDAAATFVTGLTEADAYQTLGAAIAAASNADTIRVRSNHTETAGAAITYTLPTSAGLVVCSVAFDGLGTGALTPGAVVNVGAASAAFSMTGFAYFNGITFAAGTNGSASCDVILGSTSGNADGMIFDNCTLSCPSTTTGAQLIAGVGAGASGKNNYFKFVGCTYNAANSSSNEILLRSGTLIFENLILAGATRTTVFSTFASQFTDLEVNASDLTGVAWTNLINVAADVVSFYAKFHACKLASSFAVTTGSFVAVGSGTVTLVDCNSGDVNYYYAKYDYLGSVVAQNSIYVDASDGTNNIGWTMVSSANASFAHPLESPPISFFNSALSAMTTTVETVTDNVTLKDNEIWQITLAKITSGSPVGTWNKADRAADILTAGTNQTTSTATWVGTGGITPIKQKLVSGSFTPAEVGDVVTIVKLAKASTTVYISPKVLTTSGKQYMGNGGGFRNERAVSTGAGAANILSTASELIEGTTVNGTYVVTATGNVKTGITFGAASALTGTYTGSDRWTDPGEANVKSGTAYKADSTTNNKLGTLVTGGGTPSIGGRRGIG